MATQKIDAGNFQSDVLGSDIPVVVDFWAEWCGPCKAIGPSLEEISDEMEGKVKITKINIQFLHCYCLKMASLLQCKWVVSQKAPWSIGLTALHKQI